MRKPNGVRCLFKHIKKNVTGHKNESELTLQLRSWKPSIKPTLEAGFDCTARSDVFMGL